MTKIFKRTFLRNDNKNLYIYGYDKHKGYATAEHLKAVSRFGYSSLHRKSFRPRSLLDVLNKDS